MRVNPSLAVAGTALFVALGGPAQAAKLITGADVKNSSLTGADVRNNSLTSRDVRDLRAGDFAAGALAGLSGDQGARGATGATGANGAAGPQGPKGDTGAAGAKGDKGDAGTTRWLLVDAAGVIVAQSGGFRIANAYPASPAGANGNVYIDAGEDLSDNGINATIALQNKVNQDGGGMAGADGAPDANAEFSGEISATMCAITGVVACAPTDAVTGQPVDNRNHFVVSPRLSDGQRTSSNTRKRFYVAISGTSPAAFTNDAPAVPVP